MVEDRLVSAQPTVPATVAVHRDATGRRDRLRQYKVVIDGREVGRVGRDSTWDGPIEAGDHSLYLKIDWCSSPPVTFSVKAGEAARFLCRPGGSAVAGVLDATLRRHRYIHIEAV